MSIEKVRGYFEKWDMKDKILEFDVSSATVELAAEAIGCEPNRIAKSLSFMLDKKPILVVVAGDAKVDNRKYKDHFLAKAKMLKADQVFDLVGYDIGGVCPFDVNDGVDIYLDESLKRFKTVYPACGTSNSAIELSIEELEKHSNYISWVDVCKEWE